MGNIKDIQAGLLRELQQSPTKKRVAVMAPVCDKGYSTLHERWIGSFSNTDIEAIELPVGTPYFENILEFVDGVLMPGGDSNIHPSRYADKYKREEYPGDTYDLERDEYAFKIIQRAYDKDIPILGVCRGMQEMIVAMGGALEHLKTEEINHAEGYDADVINGSRCLKGMDKHVHHIALMEGGVLSELFTGKSQLTVNSVHKEGITRAIWEVPEMKAMREKLKITAMAPDGVIEGISAKGKSCFMGLQAHFELEGPLHDTVYDFFFKKIAEYNEQRIEAAMRGGTPSLNPEFAR
ncbi:MAG: hypothetical protein CMH26_02265 [Micavibrio sp.]|nr:hypothetical protein [Micavibrio sp.]|tara:strand:+ start:1172 stop:2053 length:882 start_codon:yes stop_codon:yes gene_type:complete